MSSIDTILDQILSSTYTKHQLYRRHRLLKDFFNYKFFQEGRNFSIQDSLGKFSSQGKALHSDLNWLNSLGEGFFNLVSLQEFQGSFQSLEDKFNSLNLTIVYLPFIVNEETMISGEKNLLSSIGGWFKENLGKNTIIDIRFNPDLIAGAAISYGGVYKDYSIHSILQHKKEEIIKSLSYLKKK